MAISTESALALVSAMGKWSGRPSHGRWEGSTDMPWEQAPISMVAMAQGRAPHRWWVP